MQINAKTERTDFQDVRYRTFAEVYADLKKVGHSDEKIEWLINDLIGKGRQLKDLIGKGQPVNAASQVQTEEEVHAASRERGIDPDVSRSDD